MDGAEDISFRDLYPILNEPTSTTVFDTHYFYQDIWAFRKILRAEPKLTLMLVPRLVIWTWTIW